MILASNMNILFADVVVFIISIIRDDRFCILHVVSK